MIKTLRESKAKLSELVELAGKGQEILITVRGKVRARLSAVDSDRQSNNGVAWADELQALHKTWCKRTRKTSSTQDVLTSIREDRL
jgi:prevent-host-death family protein